MTAHLPDFLRPHRIDTLVRMGRDHDGGYVVDQRSIAAAKLLLGLGINDDWSFEEDFVRRTGAPVVAFDPTVSQRGFRNATIKSMARLDKPGIFIRNLKVYRAYRQFFGANNRHVLKYVSDLDRENSVSFDTVMGMAGEVADSDVFLKLDIEGSEYRILDDIAAHAGMLSGMAIELHDVDLHLPKIERFVANFPLKLCHLHANNYGTVSRTGLPTVLEASFTSFPVKDSKVLNLPIAHDMVNDVAAMDIPVKFGS